MKILINHLPFEKVKFYGILLALLFAFTPDIYAQSSTFLSLIGAAETASPILVTSVHQKASKKFDRKFRDAQNVKWFIQDKNHLVKFSKKDLRYQALYNKRGSLVYTICYGGEKHIPYFIKSTVKWNYVYYVINSAVNVKEANRNIWIINMENHKNRITIRVEDNILEEVLNIKIS